jgi:hypothetical protein
MKLDGSIELFKKTWAGFGYQFQAMEVEKCLAERKIESDISPVNLSLQLMNIMDNIRHQTGIVYPEDRRDFSID